MLPVTNCAKNSSPNLLYCEDCNTNFNSQSQLVQHLMSPKHINKVNRAQKQPTAGQFRGGARGTGRGQARGRGGMYMYTATLMSSVFYVGFHCYFCVLLLTLEVTVEVIFTIMIVQL